MNKHTRRQLLHYADIAGGGMFALGGMSFFFGGVGGWRIWVGLGLCAVAGFCLIKMNRIMRKLE